MIIDHGQNKNKKKIINTLLYNWHIFCVAKRLENSSSRSKLLNEIQ